VLYVGDSTSEGVVSANYLPILAIGRMRSCELSA